jgi:hypothetical protein
MFNIHMEKNANINNGNTGGHHGRNGKNPSADGG